MRVTNSVDGVKRINMKVLHRVSAKDFANALCVDYEYQAHEDLENYTRDQILEIVRKTLARNSEQLIYWADDMEPEAAQGILDWAVELVERRFPEMF